MCFLIAAECHRGLYAMSACCNGFISIHESASGRALIIMLINELLISMPYVSLVD